MELVLKNDVQAAGYRLHKYTSTTLFQATRSFLGSVLVVGGGGSGGGFSGNGTGGGGGGGAVVEEKMMFIKGWYYRAVVGAGGAGVTGYTQGTNGSNSYIEVLGTSSSNSPYDIYVRGKTTTTTSRNSRTSYLALGGGGGGRSNDGSGEPPGSDGGCGGGGGGGDANPNGIGGQSIQLRDYGYGSGYAGGTSASSSGDCGAGGGGAGGKGEDFLGSTVSYVVDGGIGYESFIEGSSNHYGGGGGAKARNTGDAGLGGLGGGGNGGSNGAANTGGGGGGSESGYNPGAGGSGLIIIKYQSSTDLVSSTGTTLTGLGRGDVRGSSPTLYGNATRTNAFGGSWLLDGSGDYITLPSSDKYAFGSNGTIGVWVRWNTTTAFSTNHRIWCVNNNITSLDLYINQSGTIYMHGGNVSVSGYTFPKNRWRHICAVYDNGTLKIYINGRLQTLSGTTTGYNITNNGTMYIGQYAGGGSYYWKGYVDDLTIHNRALNQRQVRRLRNSSRRRKRIQ